MRRERSCPATPKLEIKGGKESFPRSEFEPAREVECVLKASALPIRYGDHPSYAGKKRKFMSANRLYAQKRKEIETKYNSTQLASNQ